MYRLPLAGLLLGATLALTGCSQVAVIRSAPLTRGSFDTSFGNDPLAAADAAALQNALRRQGAVWTITINTQPAAAGDINATDVHQLVAARGKVSRFGMTVSLTDAGAQSTFSARGPEGEQRTLQTLMQDVAQAGYIHITAVRVDVYYQSSHHAVLTWTAATGFVYKVLDKQP